MTGALPNPRLQRTPSASPPSPLSRQPLGGIKVALVALATVGFCACGAGEALDDRVAVTFINSTGLELSVVEVGWAVTPRLGNTPKVIGPMKPGESRVVMLEPAVPSEVIITAWSGSCPATLWGPYVVPGMAYVASLEAVPSSTPVGEDSDCYTKLTIQLSVQVSNAA